MILRRELIAIQEKGMWSKYPSCPYCGFVNGNLIGPKLIELFEAHLNTKHKMFKQEWKVLVMNDTINNYVAYIASEDPFALNVSMGVVKAK